MIPILLAFLSAQAAPVAPPAPPPSPSARVAILRERGLGPEVDWVRRLLTESGVAAAEAERRAAELVERGLTGQRVWALRVRGVDLTRPDGAEPDPAKYAAALKEIEALEMVRGPGADSASYALSEGVSLAEAQRRMSLQGRADIGQLAQTLKARQAATFAGLWIQHRPDYRVVVAFTRDPEATLRKYTKDPLFEARLAEVSEVELERIRLRAFDVLGRAGLGFGGGTDVRENVVRIDLLNDLAEVERALAAKGLALPERVKLVPPPPLPPADAPAPTGGPVKIFPKATQRTGMQTQELRIGRLVLEDGCIRLESADGPPHPVAFFAHEMALDLSRPGEVRVKDLRSGESFRVGERLAMSGGAGNPVTKEPQLAEIARQCGAGPVAWVSTPRSYAAFREQMVTGHAQQRAEVKGISFAAAVAELRAEWGREDALAELDRVLRAEAPERYAGMRMHFAPRARLYFTGEGEELVRRHAPRLADSVEIASAPLSVAEDRRVRAQLRAALAAVETGNERLDGGLVTELETGRMTLQTEALPALSRAALEGRLKLPADLKIVTNGALGTAPQRPYGAFEAVLAGYERAPDFAELKAMVAATELPAEWAGRPEGSAGTARPGPAQAADVARWLKAYGFTAVRVQALRAAGFDPVKSWIAMNGRETPVDRALVAGETVVAELVSLDPRQAGLNDDRRTTARLRVVESLAGRLKPGEIVTVRLVSGFDPDRSFHQANDEPIVLAGLPGSFEPGARYLLSLSAPLYAHLARSTGTRMASPGGESWYLPYREPQRVEGDRVTAGRLGDAPADLAELRRALRPLAQALTGP